MRAWLFVLAVLATLQPIIQVASTEEIVSSSSMESVTNDEQTQQIKENKREKPDPATLVEIEKNLLSLFGFKKRPIVDRTKIVIPEAMKKLYADIMGHELDSVNFPKPGLHSKSANTVRSFTHEESKIDDRFLKHHRFRLYFNVSTIPIGEKLKAAELQFSRKLITNNKNKNNNNIKYKILVYDIVRAGIKGKREPIFLLVDTKTVRINSTETVSIDVLPAVERWLKTPKHNHGLFIQITHGKNNDIPEYEHIRLRRSINENNDKWSQNQPLLFTYTDDGRYKQRPIRDANRPRRAPQRKLHRRKEICQRRNLYVDFTDVGWSNWIVAPPGYEAFYCHGECNFPIADHLNSTNHAIVQTLVNSINPSIAPKACCVPTQLTSISMLYLDDQNKVVLKNYMDMTVVGCGCR